MRITITMPDEYKERVEEAARERCLATATWARLLIADAASGRTVAQSIPGATARSDRAAWHAEVAARREAEAQARAERRAERDARRQVREAEAQARAQRRAEREAKRAAREEAEAPARRRADRVNRWHTYCRVRGISLTYPEWACEVGEPEDVNA